MSYENINLWFARDEKNEIVTIDKINEENKHLKYKCPICGSDIIPKAIKENAIMTRHFAHVDKSKCDSETQIHFWIKNELIKKGDTFKVSLEKEKIKEFICKDILVEQEYKTEFGTYRPDITILTEDNQTIYFEVANTNKKKIEDYLDIWLNLNNIVVEVDAKDLLNGNNIKEFKAMFYEGKCFNTSKKERKGYNTFRKYKENVFKDGSMDNDRVKILNWFWKEIIISKNNIDYDKIDCIFKNMNKEDAEFISLILSNTSCSDMYMNYFENKLKIIKKIINDILSNKKYDGIDKDKDIKFNIGRKYNEKKQQLVIHCSYKDYDDRLFIGEEIYSYKDENEVIKDIIKQMDININIIAIKNITANENLKANKIEESIVNNRYYIMMKNYLKNTDYKIDYYSVNSQYNKNNPKEEDINKYRINFVLKFNKGIVAINKSIYITFDSNIDLICREFHREVIDYIENVEKFKYEEELKDFINSRNNLYKKLNNKYSIRGELWLEDVYEIKVLNIYGSEIYITNKGIIKDARDNEVTIRYKDITELYSILTKYICDTIRDKLYGTKGAK